MYVQLDSSRTSLPPAAAMAAPWNGSRPRGSRSSAFFESQTKTSDRRRQAALAKKDADEKEIALDKLKAIMASSVIAGEIEGAIQAPRPLLDSAFLAHLCISYLSVKDFRFEVEEVWASQTHSRDCIVVLCRL